MVGAKAERVLELPRDVRAGITNINTTGTNGDQVLCTGDLKKDGDAVQVLRKVFGKSFKLDGVSFTLVSCKIAKEREDDHRPYYRDDGWANKCTRCFCNARDCDKRGQTKHVREREYPNKRITVKLSINGQSCRVTIEKENDRANAATPGGRFREMGDEVTATPDDLKARKRIVITGPKDVIDQIPASYDEVMAIQPKPGIISVDPSPDSNRNPYTAAFDIARSVNQPWALTDGVGGDSERWQAAELEENGDIAFLTTQLFGEHVQPDEIEVKSSIRREMRSVKKENHRDSRYGDWCSICNCSASSCGYRGQAVDELTATPNREVQLRFTAGRAELTVAFDARVTAGEHDVPEKDLQARQNIKITGPAYLVERIQGCHSVFDTLRKRDASGRKKRPQTTKLMDRGDTIDPHDHAQFVRQRARPKPGDAKARQDLAKQMVVPGEFMGSGAFRRRPDDRRGPGGSERDDGRYGRGRGSGGRDGVSGTSETLRPGERSRFGQGRDDRGRRPSVTITTRRPKSRY